MCIEGEIETVVKVFVGILNILSTQNINIASCIPIYGKLLPRKWNMQ